MALTTPSPCPRCGSTDIRPFEDGSAVCGNCGLAIRGAGPTRTLPAGEEVEAEDRVKEIRRPIRIAFLGILGGLLALATIPGAFLIRATARGVSVEEHVATVFNESFGAVVCLSIVLLVLFGWMAMWAGYHVWRGFPERALYLIVAGVAIAALSYVFGEATGGATGIAGGGLTLVAGAVARRRAAEGEGEEPPPTLPETESP